MKRHLLLGEAIFYKSEKYKCDIFVGNIELRAK